MDYKEVGILLLVCIAICILLLVAKATWIYFFE